MNSSHIAKHSRLSPRDCRNRPGHSKAPVVESYFIVCFNKLNHLSKWKEKKKILLCVWNRVLVVKSQGSTWFGSTRLYLYGASFSQDCLTPEQAAVAGTALNRKKPRAGPGLMGSPPSDGQLGRKGGGGDETEPSEEETHSSHMRIY